MQRSHNGQNVLTTTVSKAVHGCSTHTSDRPWNQRRGKGNLPLVELQSRIDFLEVGNRRDLSSLNHENSFDQAGETGAAFQMADVGLDTAYV
jgi:hypothetical protein